MGKLGCEPSPSAYTVTQTGSHLGEKVGDEEKIEKKVSYLYHQEIQEKLFLYLITGLGT